MASVCRLGYLGLNVRDLGAWKKFAQDILAMECDEQPDDNLLRLRMDEQQYRFSLHKSDSDDIAYIGLEVATAGDLTEIERRLSELGIESQRADKTLLAARGVAQMCRFSGPANVAFEVFCGPTMQFEKPFHPPRAFGGFVTDHQGLGHIVLLVDDVQESLKILCDGLGFKLSDTIDLGPVGRAHFLHCNPRHHTIALLQIPGAPQKLVHFMVQVNSINDIGRALDAAAENNVEMMTSLGRHTNDQMVSFYLKSPSGFGVEYGWGAITVDDSVWTVRHHNSGSMWGHRQL